MTESRHYRIEQVTQGVYAAIAADGYGAVSNAGIIDLGNRAVVFDTFNTQQASEDLRTTVHQLTGHSDIIVVNSHWHGDHIRGNQSFRDSIIISSRQTFEMMQTIHPDRISNQKSMLSQLQSDIMNQERELLTETDRLVYEQKNKQLTFLKEMALSLPALELTLPNMIFENSLSLRGTTRSIELFALGTAHTINDTILYIPEDKIVFAADICAVDNHPLIADGDARQWLQAIDEIERLKIKRIVPGHGPIGSVEALQTMRHYILTMIDTAATMLMQDEAAIPDQFRDWKSTSNFYLNIRHLMEVR
jgi:cyclase